MENWTTFSPEELAALRAPFSVNQHTVREGYRGGSDSNPKIRWFVYIERSAVVDRLNALFPGEWSTPEPKLYSFGSTVSATVGLSIRGITRWDGGDDDSEGAKGALTNGFRRVAAYGWDIARYLYDMDYAIWTDAYTKGDWTAKEAREKEAMEKFTGWYARRFEGTQKSSETTPTKHDPIVASGVVTDVDGFTKAMQQLHEKATNGEHISGSEIGNALSESSTGVSQVTWPELYAALKEAGFNPYNTKQMKQVFGKTSVEGGNPEELLKQLNDFTSKNTSHRWMNEVEATNHWQGWLNGWKMSLDTFKAMMEFDTTNPNEWNIRYPDNKAAEKDVLAKYDVLKMEVEKAF